MPSLNIEELTRVLPHRYPMLMVDRILEVTGDSVVGIKNVTVNEPHFTGHFPDFPVMPGVLIIEAMAQVGGILIGHVNEYARGKIMFLASVDEAKILKMKHTVAKLQGIAKVDGQIVAEATLMCKVAEREAA